MNGVKATAWVVAGAVLIAASGCSSTSNKSEHANANASTGKTEATPGSVTQLSFATPRAAMDALTNALLTDDREYLHSIFGPEIDQLSSGDYERDQLEKARLGAALFKSGKVRKNTDGTYTITVDTEEMGEFEFPVPIVEVQRRWMFDTLAGVDEMMNVRIGFNELRTIRFMTALPAAQAEYAMIDHDDDGVLEFAMRLRSTEGQQDGLYWAYNPDFPPSPLGPLAASGEGHLSEMQGYNGYFFRVLTKQGPGAPGGVKDYTSGGNLVGGFAVLAYPSYQDETGVMWFLVGADNIVYEKRPSMQEKGRPEMITEYDPSKGWTRVDD